MTDDAAGQTPFLDYLALDEFHQAHASDRKHPAWVVTRADGSVLTSRDTTWNEHATIEIEHGTPLFYLMDVAHCAIYPRPIELNECQQRHILLPPEPCPFFSFTRHALYTRLDKDNTGQERASVWLYTTFGYHLHDLRVQWTFYPGHTTGMTISSRAVPFRF